MTDIVNELREWPATGRGDGMDALVVRRIMSGAASEIERLRALSPPEPTECQPESKAVQQVRQLLARNGRNAANNNEGIRVGSHLHLCEMLLGELDAARAKLDALSLRDHAVNGTTPSHNLLMQAENMIAAWERMYRLINPRDNFPKVFADLTEDMEFRELEWLRRAVAEAKPAMVAEDREVKS